MRSRRSLLVLLVPTFAMVAYCALHLRVGTDITNFLPDGSSSELAALSGQLADSPLTRTIILSIGAADQSLAIAAARELGDALRSHPEVAWVRSRVDDADFEQIYRLYFARRLGFLSDRPEQELPDALAESALRERARALRNRLASPASSFFEPLVAADPLGAFESQLLRMRADGSTLQMVDDQFVTPDGRFAILMLGTRGSAFDSARQGPLLSDVRSQFTAIALRRGGGLDLELSATGAFAVAAERAVKADVYAIGACSFVGVALLFAAFVGSLRGFLIVSIPPAAGILVATTVGLLVFGQVDGLTMAFGASLMGIVIDYSNHLLLHHGLERPISDPWRVAARLRPSLMLGAFTTVASFVGLGITPFPAFREMACFSITGVLAGLCVSLWVLPPLLEGAPPLPQRSADLAARLDVWFDRVSALPRRILFAPLGLALLAALALPAVRWSDDMSQLTRFDPDLLDENKRVRERVAQFEEGRFVIALADNEDLAVARSDEVHRRLRPLVATGDLDGTRSLHALLWSEALQARNRAALAAIPDLYARVDASFTAEGFRPGAFAAFGAALREPPPPALRLADLRASPLADLLAPFVFELGDRVAVVTYLRGLRDPGAAGAALEGMDDVYLLDQRSFVNDIYREFRRASLRQILVGAVLVLSLLALRYRAWRPVVAAFLPSVLVAVFVLAALAGLREPTNLFHVMSLVMVMGMGVDYGIFCVDSIGRRERVGVTLLSLLLSCLTTAFVFGMLAFSSQPSLRAIGVTTGIGVLLSYVLAPVTLAAAGLTGKARAGADA